MVALIRAPRLSRTWPTRLEDGSGDFRIAGFPEYGKLSKKDFDGISDGAQRCLDLDEYDKDSAPRLLRYGRRPNPMNIVDGYAPRLRPSRLAYRMLRAMAMKFLGESFDLHAGGEDLMFPHHENGEDRPVPSNPPPISAFARHWFHVRFLLVEVRKKMSKSEAAISIPSATCCSKATKPSAIRFLLISCSLRSAVELHLRRPRRRNRSRRGSPSHLPSAPADRHDRPRQQ